MRNEAAERLRARAADYFELEPDLTEALAAERKAMVERLRAAFRQRTWPHDLDLDAILDAEAAR